MGGGLTWGAWETFEGLGAHRAQGTGLGAHRELGGAWAEESHQNHIMRLSEDATEHARLSCEQDISGRASRAHMWQTHARVGWESPRMKSSARVSWESPRIMI